MGVVKDVVDSLKDVAEGIDHIRTVATAVRDGRDYLKLRHPDVRRDMGIGTQPGLRWLLSVELESTPHSES